MLYTFCCKFNRLSSSEKNYENRLRFGKIILTIGWRIFSRHMQYVHCDTQTGSILSQGACLFTSQVFTVLPSKDGQAKLSRLDGYSTKRSIRTDD